MDVRNLNRVLMFNRTLKKYNKAAGENLNLTGVLILAATNQYSKLNGATMQDIEALLKRNNRTRSRNDILKTLKSFEKQEFITKTGQTLPRYRMTLTGKNALNDLEKRIRAERIDR